MQINGMGVEGAMVAGSKEEKEGTSLVQDLGHNGRIFYQELQSTTQLKNRNTTRSGPNHKTHHLDGVVVVRTDPQDGPGAGKLARRGRRQCSVCGAGHSRADFRGCRWQCGMAWKNPRWCLGRRQRRSGPTPRPLSEPQGLILRMR